MFSIWSRFLTISVGGERRASGRSKSSAKRYAGQNPHTTIDTTSTRCHLTAVVVDTARRPRCTRSPQNPATTFSGTRLECGRIWSRISTASGTDACLSRRAHHADQADPRATSQPTRRGCLQKFQHDTVRRSTAIELGGQ